jgi:hypothetical protein
VNEELRRLFEADQQDRAGGTFAPGTAERDGLRRLRVAELLAARDVEDAEDLFHAAMIFQHGSSLEDYWQAHELAKARHRRPRGTGRAGGWRPRRTTVG